MTRAVAVLTVAIAGPQPRVGARKLSQGAPMATTTNIELDEFLSTTLTKQVEAERAIHNGDVAPRLEMWSMNDPVTLFGAWGPCNSGWDEVSRTFRWVASRFLGCSEYRFELVAAGVSGDLAYTVGYEHSVNSVDGGPMQPNRLRVTHVYRREDGEWRIVHRHGDHPPVDQSPTPDGSQTTVRETS
jgi:ketosteroid isomerase-like protein